MSKRLYGRVTKENVEYEWKSEPGACEICKAMDGTIYQSANDIPDRPHPNCKCWIDVLEKEKDTKDPIELHREKIKDRKRNELEVSKLLGDAKSLEEEIDEYVRQINEREKELNNLEEIIEIEELEPKYGHKVKNVQEQINYAKYKADKAKQEVNTLKIQIENTLYVQDKISGLKVELDKLRKKIDDLAVKLADNWSVQLYGDWHAFVYNMPEANNFFKIAIDKKNYNSEYVQKNGKLYYSIDDLHNENLSKSIRSRISKELSETDCKVLVLNPDSTVAQKIKQSYAFRQFLTDNMNSIFQRGDAPDTTIEFSNLDKDLYSTFHGADVKNIRLDAQGNLNMRIEDYYNFNPNRTSVKGRIGEKLQKQGKLEPYYVITILKVPKEVWGNYILH